MNSGFNLTSDKVLNTDYFKVKFKYTLLSSRYTVTELKWLCGSFIKCSLLMPLSFPGSICWCSWTCEIKKGLPRKRKFTNKKQGWQLPNFFKYSQLPFLDTWDWRHCSFQRVSITLGVYLSQMALEIQLLSVIHGCSLQAGFCKTRVDLQCSLYREVIGKIYCLKQLFLPPVTTWRFTKIKLLWSNLILTRK